MTLRLKNGRFATAAKARKQRNKWFHRALISACAALRRAGFDGEYVDVSVNERIIELYEPVSQDEIIAIASDIESTRQFPEIIYNVSFRDTNGRWFAATKAWESIELSALEIKRRIGELMERYQRADSGPDSDPDDYMIDAVMVSVYPWRR